MSEPVYGIPSPIEYGPVYSLLADAPTNWGMAACRVDSLRAAGGTGKGQVVAVLDTGIDSSHPEFAGKLLDAKSFVPGESVDDRNGHGTHCAGTVLGLTPTVGVAPDAKLLVGKCLSNGGSGSSSWIANAFRWAVDAGATVVSMSIGGPGFIEGMEPLFREAIAKGVIPVVAAGNERQQGGVVRYLSSGLVVAAVDVNGRIATFSNPGIDPTTLSTTAPGVNILSARSGGGYATMSGTSMATPFAAGCAANVQSGRSAAGLPPLTAAQFKEVFASRNVDAGPPGPDRDYGPGLIDCNLLALTLVPPPKVG